MAATPEKTTEVVVFDFDGTLTTADTFVRLLLFARGGWGTAWLLLRFMPMLMLMMVGLYDGAKAKERLFGHCFGGMALADFNRLCDSFARQNACLLRSDTMQLLRQASLSGTHVAVVSASVSNWVCRFLPGVRVISTAVEVSGGILTGRFSTPDCIGEEKVRRLLQVFPRRTHYRLTAYGDSRGDRQLLAFADEKHWVGTRQRGTG